MKKERRSGVMTPTLPRIAPTIKLRMELLEAAPVYLLLSSSNLFFSLSGWKTTMASSPCSATRDASEVSAKRKVFWGGETAVSEATGVVLALRGGGLAEPRERRLDIRGRRRRP